MREQINKNMAHWTSKTNTKDCEQSPKGQCETRWWHDDEQSYTRYHSWRRTRNLFEHTRWRANEHFATKAHGKHATQLRPLSLQPRLQPERRKRRNNQQQEGDKQQQQQKRKHEGRSLRDVFWHNTRNARWLNNGDPFDELHTELEGCKWDANFPEWHLETRKKDLGVELWSHHHERWWLQSKNTESEYSWMRDGCGKSSKKEQVSERMIIVTIKRHQRRIELASVCFSRSVNTDVHFENMYKCNENHSDKKLRSSRVISTLSLDLLMSLKVTTLESVQWRSPSNVVSGWNSVGESKTLSRSIQNSKKVPEKQTTFRSASGKDKQLDYVLIY